MALAATKISEDMSTLQKAAVVLVSMGAEHASKMYHFFSEEDIERVTTEIAKLVNLPSDEVDFILEEYYNLCLTQKVMTEGGSEYAMDVLEKAFGREQAMNFMSKINKLIQTKAFDFLRKADYKSLLSMLQNEHPQTIALVLSYARSDQASMILAELPKDKRIDVVEKIAKMDSASPDIVKSVERILEKKFSKLVSLEATEVGGINYIADVLNNVDRGTEKYIFDELTVRDPELVEEIRQKMFVFEDIAALDSPSIQRFMKDVDPNDLAVALKGSIPDVQEVFYANMSQRMKESVKSDIEFLHNVRLRDVEEAQQRIVAIIRRLEDEGELVIAKGGKDEVIA